MRALAAGALASALTASVAVLHLGWGAGVQERVLTGQVRESRTGRPLEASVAVYGQLEETGKVGDCPLFGRPIDATQSDARDGGYDVRVPATLSFYRVVACRSGYWPRAEPGEVEVEQFTIMPNPIDLQPTDGGPEELAAAIRGATNRYLADMAYLRSVNADWFEGGLDALIDGAGSEPRRALVRATRDVLREAGPRN